MFTKFNHKIALGSVQFGLNYGIGNTSGKTKFKEVKKIIEIANKSNISTLDTAILYGKAESTLGQIGIRNFEIISKFSVQKKSIHDEFLGSIERLQTDQLYGYLFHNCNELITTPSLWNELNKLKKIGKVKKIGFSAYYPEEIEQLIKLGIKPDLIQIPFSIFDQRFKPHFPIYKKLGIEIHTRSAFLQGLPFLNLKQLDEYFQEFKGFIADCQNICKSNYNLLASSLLSFCLSQPEIDKVVIGVITSEQLKLNLSLLSKGQEIEKQLSSLRNQFDFNEEKLIPFNWPK